MPDPIPHFLFVSAPFGGVDVFARNVQAALSTRTDIRTSWIFIEWEPPELLASIPPISWNWSWKASYLASRRIRNLRNSGHNFDAALFFHLTPLLLLQALPRTIPIVLSLDATPNYYERYRKYYQSEPDGFLRRMLKSINDRRTRNVYHQTTRILPWSISIEESLAIDYQVPRSRLQVLPPGIDVQRWDNAMAERIESNSTIRCLFVGGEFIRKGGDWLLKIAGRPEFARYEFHVVTRRPTEVHPPNVFYYNDLQPNSERLREVYSQSDIFFLPTRADFAPTISVCEAMAMRLPVVTTRVGGLENVVRDGENGFCVESGNIDALAQRLLVLGSNAALRKKMGECGRRIVERDYNIRANSDIIVSILKSLAGY
jgi:glycosyltransferase involved in cell wall biosynthesis